jgi:hypothetical protein
MLSVSLRFFVRRFWQSIGSFLNAEHIPENQMQEIAAEINFAESTYY